jgi:hypothetical protein
MRSLAAVAASSRERLCAISKRSVMVRYPFRRIVGRGDRECSSQDKVIIHKAAEKLRAVEGAKK